MEDSPKMKKSIITFSEDNFEPEFFTNDQLSEDDEPLIVESDQHPVEEKYTPIDRYNLVYVLFYLFGTSTLLPWYFFVTCNDYWMYRFHELPHHPKESYLMARFLPEDDPPSASNRTSLQADFTSYISIASTVPSTIFLFFNVFFFKRFSIHWRVVSSSLVLLILFVETTVLVLFDTDSWQYCFFVVTLITVVLLNMSTALLQAALCGFIMKFPVRYISAFSAGQSLAGVFAAVTLIITSFVDIAPTIRTFIYFIFGDITILISFIGYMFLRKSEYFQHYISESKNDAVGSIQYRRLRSEFNRESLSINYVDIQKKMWIPSIGLFTGFVVTTAIYPAVAVLVCSVNFDFPAPGSKNIFVTLVTYLLYCICEYSGRICAGIVQRPRRFGVIIFSVARVLLIPLLMLCNAQPRHHLPVLFHSDLIYILIIVILAFSNGYITNLTFILLPGCVLSHEQEVASSMLITWLAAALSIGSLLSFLLVNML